MLLKMLKVAIKLPNIIFIGLKTGIYFEVNGLSNKAGRANSTCLRQKKYSMEGSLP